MRPAAVRRLPLALLLVTGLALPLAGAVPSAEADAVRGRASATTPTYVDYKAPGGMGEDAGEPSIGANHRSGKVMYQAVLETLQVDFDDKAVPAKASWKDVTNPVEGVTTLDPILFTDSPTGRTFVSQLAPPCSVSSFTDTDGEGTGPLAAVPGSGWTTSTGCGVGANFDHQTFSAGPAPAGLPTTWGPNRVVYYCSQLVVQATCARSVDGGITFGQSAVMYTIDAAGLTGCSGLHGHLKVGPDGTAYMPNMRCTTPDGGSKAALVVADPGPVLDFEIRPLPPQTTAPDFDSDPAVAIDAANTAYVVWEDADNNAMVAVTKDRGLTYTDITDIGKPFKIKNATMPAAVAGSAGRAAVAFLGTPTEAPANKNGFRENQLKSFSGSYHLYVATTYDYGKRWTVVDATPHDPVQRGCIWWGGVDADAVPEGDAACRSNPDRNLLDFMDMTVDETGRVLVGYADGCLADCISDKDSRMRAAKGSISRQTCGKGLLAAYDSKPEGPLRACAGKVSARSSELVPVAGEVASGGAVVTTPRALTGTLAATGPSAALPLAAAALVGGAALLRRRAASAGRR